MAGEDTTLKIGGDAQALLAALQQGGTAFSAFVSKASADAAGFSAKLHEVSGAKLLGEANQYATAVQQIGGASKLTAAEQAKLNGVLTQASDKYKALGQEVPAAIQAMVRETQTWQAGAEKMVRAGDSLQTIGNRLTVGVSLPLAAAGGAALKAAIDFESSFAGIRKTVDATEPEFAALSDGIRQMALEIPLSVNELNRIGESAGQLGIKTANILGFTEAMAGLGISTTLSAEQAATSLAQLANVTGMSQDEFSNLGSAVVALGNSSATNESKIVDFGLRMAGAGKLAGLSQGQILGIAAAFASSGIEAEAGGTAVQKVLLGMTQAVTTGNSDLQSFADAAGMSAGEFARAFREDAGGAFTAFVEGLGRAGNDAFVVLQNLGLEDQRLVRSFLSVAGAGDQTRRSMELGTEAYRENTALAKEVGERTKTTASQMQLLQNAFYDARIELGQALLPHLKDAIAVGKDLVASLAELIDGFRALPAPVQDALVKLALIGVVAGPALSGIGTLVKAGGQLTSALVGVSKAAPAMAGGVRLVGAAALASAPQVAAFVVAASSVVAIGSALRNGVGLYTDSLEQNQLATEQNKSHQLALAAASQVAGRTITDVAEANDILRERAAALQRQHRESQVTLERTVAATDAFGSATIRSAEDVEEAAKKALDFKKAQDALFGRDLIAKASDYAKTLGDVNNVTQLSTEKKEELRKAVTDAIDAYQRLGQDVPPYLRLLEAATRPLLESTHQWGTVELKAALDNVTPFAASVRSLGLDAVPLLSTAIDKGRLGFVSLREPVADSRDALERMRLEGARLRDAIPTWGTSLEAFATELPKLVQQAFTGGGGLSGAASAGGSLLGQTAMTQLFGKNGEGGFGLLQHMSGFMGNFLSSAMPVIGSMVGPAVQKLIGMFSKPEYQEIAKDVGRQWGVSISEGLAKQIEADAQQYFSRDRVAGTIFNLDQVIQEAGGLTSANYDKFLGKLHDVFSMIEVGKFSVEQGREVLDANFGTFAAQVEQSGQVASQAFLDILDLNQRFGTESQAIAQFIETQAGKVGAGLATMLAPLETAYGGLATKIDEAKAKVGELAAAGKTGTEEHAQALAALDALYAEQAAGAATAGETVDRMGRLALATFNAAIEKGASWTAAIDGIGPGLDRILSLQQDLGLESENAAVKELLRYRSLTQEHRELIASADGLNQTMLAMSNIGALNEETLGDLEAQGRQTFQQLTDAGFSEQESLRMMRDWLVNVLKSHEDLGIPIDENTQALIDQARAQGILKDEGLSTNDILMQGIGALIKAVGGELPAAWQKSGQGALNMAADAVAGMKAIGKSIKEDVIEMHSPTGIEGISHYAKLAGADLVAAFDAAYDHATQLSDGVRGLILRLGDTQLGRAVASAAAQLKSALVPERTSLDGHALLGKGLDLWREVQALNAGTSKELIELQFKFQDELKGLGPDPKAYRVKWEAATDTVRAALADQLDEIEAARQQQLAALGQLPEDYAASHELTTKKIEREYAKQKTAIEDRRRRELENLDETAAGYGVSLGVASQYVEDEYAYQLAMLEAKTAKERDAVAMTPDEYAVAYQAAAEEVNKSYDQMGILAQEKAQKEIDALGPLPDEYDRQYTAILDLMKQKYAAMVAEASKAALSIADAMREVLGWLGNPLAPALPSPTGPITATPIEGGGGTRPTAMLTQEQAVQFTQNAAQLYLHRRLSPAELSALAEEGHFSGGAVSEVALKAFLSAKLEEVLGEPVALARGGLAWGPTRALIGEAGAPEIVGPRGFMTEALAGAMRQIAAMEGAMGTGAPLAPLGAQRTGGPTVGTMQVSVDARGAQFTDRDSMRELASTVMDVMRRELLELVPARGVS